MTRAVATLRVWLTRAHILRVLAGFFTTQAIFSVIVAITGTIDWAWLTTSVALAPACWGWATAEEHIQELRLDLARQEWDGRQR